jgi:catechol 2,3-dioxygenase-like lactoylglutathione lyase family enzyme
MSIELDHTIVPAHDRQAAAEFFARVFGLQVCPAMGPFSPVRVNDALTLDFADETTFEPHHYAFFVDDAEFDRILSRIQGGGLPYSADPYAKQVGQINHRNGGRGLYFRDPNGHVLEILTRTSP